MTELDKPRRREAQRKLRASERRDNELADFCSRMAKQAGRSSSAADRRDATYWRDMEAYFRATEEYVPPQRRNVPNTRRLEFFVRALDRVAAAQTEEVARLRSEGVSWQAIGEAVGLTRQGAIVRWAEAVEARASELAEYWAEDHARIAEQGEALRDRLTGGG